MVKQLIQSESDVHYLIFSNKCSPFDIRFRF